MPDVLEQLRHYGEAVEQEALRVQAPEPDLRRGWWSRRPAMLLAAAAAIIVLALGGVVLRLVLTDTKVKVVATKPNPLAPATTTPEDDPTATTATATDESTTTTSTPATPDSVPVAPATTTTIAGRRSATTATAPSTPTTTGLAVTTTSSTAPATTTTAVAPQQFTTLRGTATWTGGPDPRGRFEVGACPVGNSATGCGEDWRITTVGADGSFELLIPRGATARDWDVVALVSHSQYSCAFNCFWRTSQAGPPTTISDADAPATLALSVTARIVDVYVRDRNNQPFEGGGVMVTDIRCPKQPCPANQSPMYSEAFGAEGGRARIVVDPAQTYDLMGMAQNTGWPNPQITRSDGSTSWHSSTIRRKGSDIAEGHVFLVNGAPA